MNGMPRVSVAPDRVTVRPGESVGVEVTIQNTTQAVEHYGAAVVGLPRDDLFGCEPSVVKLRPGESGSVQMTITIPERPAPDAGLYTLGVLVRSPYQRNVSRCEELRMDLQPAPALTVDAQPEVVVGGPDATYTLRVANEGNTVVAVTLTGSDQEKKVSFAFRPRSVQIAPNSSAPATVTVRATAPWTGQEVRRMLTVRAAASPELAAEKSVTFVQRPRVPGGPMKVAGLAAAVLTLAGATIAGALVNKAHDTANKASQNATAPTPGPANVPPPPANASTAPAGAVSRTTAPSGGSGGGSAKPGGGGSGITAGKTTVIDFSTAPNGQPAGDQFIDGGAYAAKGVTLASSVEFAPPTCRTATAVALRTVSTVGAFLTSSSPANVAACNTLPVKITFATPVKAVKLVFVPDGGPWRMRVELADGGLQDVTETPPAGGLATIPFDPAGVVSVTFGGAGTDPNVKQPTAIKRIIFTGA